MIWRNSVQKLSLTGSRKCVEDLVDQPRLLPPPAVNMMTASLERADTHRDVLGAALKIGVLTALVRLASVGKELIVAWRFGTGDDLDAFLVSILVPVAMVAVLASAFSASFIPIYIETKQKDGVAAAQRLFQSVVGWVLLSLLIVAFLVAFASPWYLRILGSGFGPEKLRFTTKLVWLNSLVIIFGGLAAVWSAALNAERQFAVVAIMSVATPVLTLVFLWFAPDWRAFTLVAGLITGSVTEMVLLGLALHRVGLSV